MKKNKAKLLIGGGIFCLLTTLISTWYAVAFNDSRLVVPMDFDTYTFQTKDLPMILSVPLDCAYAFILVFILLRGISRNRNQAEQTNTTRKLNPKLGFLGLFGFLGFLGFPTFRMTGDISAFVFFAFFGFFGFYYEGKMSGTFMDERFRENASKAQLNALKITCGIIYIALILFAGSGGRLLGRMEYDMIGLVIVVSLAMALGTFLSEYLLYRYDHDDQLDGSEE